MEEPGPVDDSHPGEGRTVGVDCLITVYSLEAAPLCGGLRVSNMVAIADAEIVKNELREETEMQ